MNSEYTRTEYNKLINQYNNFKERIIHKAKKSNHEFTLEIPKFDVDFEALEKCGIDVDRCLDDLEDDYINSIVENLPQSVKQLNASIELFDDSPNLMKKFENIRQLKLTPSLSIGDYSCEHISSIVEKSNVDTVIINNYSNINFNVENSFYVSYRGMRIFKNKKFKIIADSTELDDLVDDPRHTFPSIYLNKDVLSTIDINIIKETLTKYINVDNTYLNIYRNNKHVYTYMKSNGDDFKNIYNCQSIINCVFYEPIEQFVTDIKCLSQVFDNNIGCINVNVKNKTYKDIDKLKELEKISNVTIEYDDRNSKCSIEEFKTMRKTIDYYISLINKNDLSPAEKVCYAYDLIKARVYKENSSNKSQTRMIHSIINSGEIVCVGYSEFLSELLAEVGIKAFCVKANQHQRNIIEIDDDKYGIHGKYAFDPTWDSNMNSYLIQDGDRKRIVYELNGDEKVIKQFNNLSNYNYFFIPASRYSIYFFEELKEAELSEDIAWVNTSNDVNLKELDIYGFRRKDKCDREYFESAPDVNNSTIQSLIYNTRVYEGFPKETNDKLIKDVQQLKYYFLGELLEYNKNIYSTVVK